MIQQLIDHYKQIRTERYLCQTYQYQYVFVGMGQHSLSCLYPVLRHLGVPLKYICVTSERKTRLIECKFPGTRATTSLDEVLSDESVKGVRVSLAVGTFRHSLAGAAKWQIAIHRETALSDIGRT